MFDILRGDLTFWTSRWVLLPVLFLSAALVASGQNRIGTGNIVDIYQQHCAVCHGGNLDGGVGGSLLIDDLIHGNDDETLRRIIHDGIPDAGMQAFGDVLSSKEIRGLVIYLREMRHQHEGVKSSVEQDGQYSSDRHDFKLETVVETEGEIWGMSFLPDGRMIFTEKEGKLYLYDGESVSDPIKNVPEIWLHGQGGLMEVAVHPDYEDNGWIYLAFSEKTSGMRLRTTGMTTIVRGRIVDHEWVDEERIWKAPNESHTSGRVHFGTRIVFQDGYLFFSVGDRGSMDGAQDLSLPNGKIYRIYDDGRIPADNPFVDHENAITSIWSYGHRNPQGLDFHPVTGELWSTEHGPRGGDELNHIEKGLNYGWPVITYGMNYNGTPLTDLTEKEGMEQPKIDWTPSIAVCGIDFYRGDAFPNWKNDLFVTGLASQQLHRVRIIDNEVVEEEVILKDHGRLRDVISGPDGALYVAANLGRSTLPGSAILRLSPVGR
jgi:glucose/arabinose dehydrogenase